MVQSTQITYLKGGGNKSLMCMKKNGKLWEKKNCVL